MIFAPFARKLALTAHVTASLGWLGSVACFVALAVAGLRARDAASVRAACLAMETIASTVIVPLSIASLATGIVQSLGTTWGLVRHYWVVMKLILTVVATFVLLMHIAPIKELADMATAGASFGVDERRMQVQLLVDAVAGGVILLAATLLSIYKPKGLTPLGHERD